METSGCNADRRCNADVPGQQFGDAVDGMIGDTADHLAQIGFRIEAVELGGFDKRICYGSESRARRRCC